MADTPILTVPMDTSEFDAFVEKFEKLRQDIAGGLNPFAGLADEFRASADHAAELNAQIAAIVQSVNSARMTGPQSGFVVLSKNTHGMALDWKQIDKSVANTNKSFTSLSRSWFSVASLKKGPFGLFAAGATVAGAAAYTANDLANDNKRNRELGLKPGEVPAFNNDYKRFGLSDADVARVRDATGKPEDWRAFVLAGLDPQQAQRMNPAELTAFMDKWAGQQARQWQAQGIPFDVGAKNYGLDKLFNSDQLRLAGSYTDEQHDETLKQFHADIPRFAVDQKTEDLATAQQRDWNNFWTGAKRDFEKSFMTLTPQILKVADAFGNVLDAFASSPEIKQDLTDLATGLDDVLKFFRFAKKVNSDPQNNPDADAREDVHQFGLTVLKGVKQSYWDIHDWMTGTPQGTHSDQPAPTQEGPYSAWTKAASQRYNLPPGLQDLQIQIESGGIPNIVNDKTGAEGLMQFMPGTSKQMGINPFDPKQAIFGAGDLVDRYRKIYGTLGKGLAAYDGDTHISADAIKYKNWLMGAKQETLNYLRTFQSKGFDLGLSPDETQYLEKHGNVLKYATNDANLKTKKGGLDESQFQTIDLSQENKPLTQQQTADAVAMGTMSGMDKFMSLFREGGGAQFRMPDARRDKPNSNTQAPVNVNVNVSTPPGLNTNTTMGSLPH